MKVGQLIKALQALNPEMEAMILDGFNGGGTPRTINLGPSLRKITEDRDGNRSIRYENAGQLAPQQQGEVDG